MLFTTVVGLFTNKQSLTSFMRRISIRKIGNILITFGTNVCLMQKEKNWTWEPIQISTSAISYDVHINS